MISNLVGEANWFLVYCLKNEFLTSGFSIFSLITGARMFYNSQDVLWRRKLEEQAELQQALELQSRRLMGLQLLDVKKNHNRSISAGSPIQSPIQSPNFFSQNHLTLSSIHGSTEAQHGINFTRYSNPKKKKNQPFSWTSKLKKSFKIFCGCRELFFSGA